MTFDNEEDITDQYCDGIIKKSSRGMQLKRIHRVIKRNHRNYYYQILSGWLHLCNDAARAHDLHGDPMPDIRFYDYARTILVALIGKGKMTPTEVKRTKVYKREMRKFYYHGSKKHSLELSQEYYRNNKEAYQLYQHDYYLRHRQQTLLRSEIDYAVNRQKRLQQSHENYLLHKVHKAKVRRVRIERDRLRVLVNFTFNNL